MKSYVPFNLEKEIREIREGRAKRAKPAKLGSESQNGSDNFSNFSKSSSIRNPDHDADCENFSKFSKPSASPKPSNDADFSNFSKFSSGILSEPENDFFTSYGNSQEKSIQGKMDHENREATLRQLNRLYGAIASECTKHEWRRLCEIAGWHDRLCLLEDTFNTVWQAGLSCVEELERLQDHWNNGLSRIGLKLLLFE